MIRILTRDDVARALPMSEAIKAVKSAFAQLSQNGAVMPVRSSVQVPDHIEPAIRAAEAVAEADVICTATTSPTPVFNDANVRAGTHINAVGAYTPEMQEVPPETLLRSRVVIDHLESGLAEAGDVLIPMWQGLMGEDHIHAELGEIISGVKAGRASEDEVTLFKSVGVAVQDVAAAKAALAAARSADLGTRAAL